MGHKPILGRILSIVFTLALTALPVATSGWARSGVVPQATLFDSPISPLPTPSPQLPAPTPLPGPF